MVKLSSDCPTMLLVIQTSLGDVLGGIMTDPWNEKMNHSFYGDGTCSVFSFYKTDDPQLYKGTGDNNYYILMSEQHFAMGSGGNFAIFLVYYVTAF